MVASRLVPLAIVMMLMGAGCIPSLPLSEVGRSIPKLNVPKNGESALPCLAFSARDGFAAWLDAYENGSADAINLATQANLPEQANKKLVSDMRTSLDTGAIPSFVCALSNDGRDAAWVMEPPFTEGAECRNRFYVSINGIGTTSDLTSTGRTTDCHQLCKPKRWETDLLVWQCDLREQDGVKQWSQMNMDRKTGAVEIVKCQKDALGMPGGCIE